MRSITVQSPGRINIIGEHTDYNEGFVLPAAIDKKAIFTVKTNSRKSQVCVVAEDMGESFLFDLDSFKPLNGGWQNYVMGVVHELKELGAKIEGFDASFRGDVPIGGGMSSSAALECSLAYALNELFELGLTKWQLIKASQMAEHHFVGIKCGIMDQFASMMGRKDHVMLLDCRSLEYKYFPLELGEYQLVLLNTGVSHTLATSEYNQRRAECEEGVVVLQQLYPKVKSLRDATINMLRAAKDKMSEVVYRRCYHVITENARVLEATEAMVSGDIAALGKLVYQSHDSLKNDYEVSCAELDFLVKKTLKSDYVLGSRMMGGGFGGCTLNIVQEDNVDLFIKEMAQCYQAQFDIVLEAYQVTIEQGTSPVNIGAFV